MPEVFVRASLIDPEPAPALLTPERVLWVQRHHLRTHEFGERILKQADGFFAAGALDIAPMLVASGIQWEMNVVDELLDEVEFFGVYVVREDFWDERPNAYAHFETVINNAGLSVPETLELQEKLIATLT